ncbi:S-adenosyl-L-methionine-dependent methyltransferase [Xylariales sp. PMI_506]|nr:S-adenosyl-L-methionine-dependent methyltransferase [Xylariales sp. PMI_506]
MIIKMDKSALYSDPTTDTPQLTQPSQIQDVPTRALNNKLLDAQILPSQILGSYNRIYPPQRLPAETFPSSSSYTSQTYSRQRDLHQNHELHNSDPHHDPAPTSDDRTGQSISHNPSIASVVEPDSIVGESGRLYHGYKEGKYFLPNDAAEQDRLDIQHEVLRLLYDGWLSMVPFQKAPKHVLDIGTGTGIWASEFAKHNPDSYVIGTDLSAIQPTPRYPNCTFVKADAEDDWVFTEPNLNYPRDDSSESEGHHIMFDYVHLRYLYTCFNDVRTVMRHAYDNLNPGGWIEFQEARIKCHQANPDFKGDAIQRWGDGCILGAQASGRDIEKVLKYKGWLEEIGFVGVEERQLLMPFGGWHRDPQMKRVGEYNMKNVLKAIGAVGWIMLRNSGMETEEVETLVNETLLELRDPNSHSYCINYLIYAQKPKTTDI